MFPPWNDWFQLLIVHVFYACKIHILIWNMYFLTTKWFHHACRLQRFLPEKNGFYSSLCMMHISMNLDLDANLYDAFIFDPWPLCMYVWCICVWFIIIYIYDPWAWLWWIYLWFLTLDPDACMQVSMMHIYMILDPDVCVYDAGMNDAYPWSLTLMHAYMMRGFFVTDERTDGRTDKPILGVGYKWFYVSLKIEMITCIIENKYHYIYNWKYKWLHISLKI